MKLVTTQNQIIRVKKRKKYIKMKLGLSNYVMKSEINTATDVDTSALDRKAFFPSLKPTVDELNIDKLKLVPTDLCRLSNVDNDVVKKNLYIELFKKLMQLIQANKIWNKKD